MQRNVVLLVDADTETACAVKKIADEEGLELWMLDPLRQQQIPEREAAEVAMVILDAGLEIQYGPVMDALRVWGHTRRVIVLSDLEETYARTVAISRGARAYFGKPVPTERLRIAIGELAHEAREEAGCRCASGGDPCPDCSHAQLAAAPKESLGG